MVENNKPRILIFDIETSPAKSYHWRMFKENISIEQLIEPTHVLCVGVQWFGQKEVKTFAAWELGEEEMLKQIHALLMEADAVVGKNSIKFDLPHLKTWFLKYGLDPLPQLTHIDLEKTARYQFNFQSNKLDYIVQFLGLGSKVDHEGFKLWRKVLDGNEVAQRKMLRYCAHDVRITSRLYKKMRPWISDHPAMRAIGTENCPTCQSKNTQRRGWRYTKCFRIRRHQCKDCRAWFSGKREKVA